MVQDCTAMDSAQQASQAEGVCGHRKEEERVTACSPSGNPSESDMVLSAQHQMSTAQLRAQRGQDSHSSQRGGVDFSDCTCAQQQQSLHRSVSDTSVDSGVTAGDNTDVLLHSQRLRKIADERITPEKRLVAGILQQATRGEATARCGSSTAGPSAQRDDSIQPTRPDFLQLLDASTSSPGLAGQNSTALAAAADRRPQQLSPDACSQSVASSVAKGSKKGVPDFSLATTKHRSLRRRKQAIDESLVWIRKQLDTIEWQNQDMICMLLRNIKELRDFKQTMTPCSGTTTDSGLLQHGRFNSFRGESRFQRPAGAVYRPRLKTLS